MSPTQKKYSPSVGTLTMIGRSSSWNCANITSALGARCWNGRLILVPSQQSKRKTQHLRYPAEATIVGRVTAITQDIVEPSAHEVRA